MARLSTKFTLNPEVTLTDESGESMTFAAPDGITFCASEYVESRERTLGKNYGYELQ